MRFGKSVKDFANVVRHSLDSEGGRCIVGLSALSGEWAGEEDDIEDEGEAESTIVVIEKKIERYLLSHSKW